MTLKEALENQRDIAERDADYIRLSVENYIDLLESIVLKQDEAFEAIRWSWANDAGRQCDNLAHETQSEILKMLQPESES